MPYWGSRIPLSKPQMPLTTNAGNEKTLEDFSTIANFDEGHIVTNPNALSIAYPMKAILKSMKVPTNHPITMQNQLANALSGTTSPKIFLQEFLTRRLSKISLDSPVVYQRIQLKDNTQVGTITLTFTPETDDPIYLEMAGTMGEEDMEMTPQRRTVCLLSSSIKTRALSVAKNQKANRKHFALPLKMMALSFLTKSLLTKYFALKRTIRTNESTRVKTGNFLCYSFSGTMDVFEDSTVLTTIPYSTGWKVWVDGQEVETYKILDSLLGFTISKGTHRIDIVIRLHSYWKEVFESLLLFYY